MTKSQQVKKELTSRVVVLALLLLVLVFAVMYIISLNLSLGWMADNRHTQATGMEVAVRGDQFDILIERTSEYDTLIDSTPKYADIPLFKSQLSSRDGYDFTEVSTEDAASLAFELVNEVHYSESGVNYRFLMPGSYGTLTFYLKPKNALVSVANIQLSIDAFSKVYAMGSPTFEKVEEENLSNLLKGHILFFDLRTGATGNSYRYNGLITDGTITYVLSEHAKCTEPGKTDCYKITLYWEWPALYSYIAENTTEEGGAAQRFPAEVATYVDQNRNYFFAANQNSNDPDLLDDGYNDGDQIIGQKANVLAVRIDVN